ncbi:MAG: phosphonoacetaldehyde reductase [Maledivibacter sp.]|jgi:phosphonate metabolism-associated iron-containing alcohol dehydrogenase|nr:phosphonoacetaldehyde reductase [Maledivibacter sp.]
MGEIYYNPTKIIIDKSYECLDKLLKENSEKRILILCSNNFLKRNKMFSHLFNRQKNVLVYNNVQNNPDINYIYDVLQDLNDKKIEYIIAIGGGSIIDTGKAVATFNQLDIKNQDELRKYIIEKKYLSNKYFIPIAAIPTTAGTGSEVTSWATVWDMDNEKKYSIACDKLYPQKAIIDPSLTTTLPMKLTASTGLDALTHAVESYWAKASNSISKMYATKAIGLVIEALPDLLEELGNSRLREKMMLASLYAGLAFSNTKTTACHSISYPLTMKYNIPHGIAVSITLAEVMELNTSHMQGFDILINAFKVKNTKDVQNFITSICNRADIKYRLRDYGVAREDILDIVHRSYTKGRMDNNPRDLTKQQIEIMLTNLL